MTVEISQFISHEKQMGTTVKMLKKLDVTDLAGEKVMIDFDSGKYFMLSGAANDIWDVLDDEITIKDIVRHLTGIYEIDEEECLQSTVGFLDKLVDLNIIRLEA